MSLKPRPSHGLNCSVHGTTRKIDSCGHKSQASSQKRTEELPAHGAKRSAIPSTAANPQVRACLLAPGNQVAGRNAEIQRGVVVEALGVNAAIGRLALQRFAREDLMASIVKLRERSARIFLAPAAHAEDRRARPTRAPTAIAAGPTPCCCRGTHGDDPARSLARLRGRTRRRSRRRRGPSALGCC